MSWWDGISKIVVRRSAVLRFLCSAVLLFGGAAAADLPFPVGEQLTFSASWNGIPVAEIRAVTEVDTYKGREVLAIRMSTRTYAFFNPVFKVDDFHESLVDPATFRPIQFTKNLKEGHYRCHEVTTFDFEAMQAHYEHQTSGRKKSYDIDDNTRDILSFMYFMRSEPLRENSAPEYRVMADEKLYDLTLKTKTETRIALPNYERKVASLEMVPEAMFDGLFVSKGKATVWVSRDARRLLTFAKIKVPFGRARILLKSVRGPGNDFWITELKDDDDDE
jgi:hypothetical protein